MNNLINFALTMIESNPGVKNSPFAQQGIQAIKTGNNQMGEQLANNFLNTMGMTREDCVNRARNMFHI